MERESFEDDETAALHERALRPRQGRPRGAPRRRRHLHGGGAGDDRPGRLADDRLPRPRGRAVLRRHLLPARAAPGHAELPAGAGGDGRGLRGPSARSCAPRADRVRERLSAVGRIAASRRTRSTTRAARARGRGLLAHGRPAQRRLRRRAQVPAGQRLEFLLGARRDATHVERTLDAMAHGGIYDQLGGGFARYSVDAVWLVPHFEKMLYDNALLARAYLHGWQVTGTRALAAGRARDARLGAARDARPGGRLLLRARRRLRGRGGPLLRLGRGRDPRGAARASGIATEAIERVLGYCGVSAAGNFEGRNILHVPLGAAAKPPAGPRRGPPRAARQRASSACAPGSTTSASPPGTR